MFEIVSSHPEDLYYLTSLKVLPVPSGNEIFFGQFYLLALLQFMMID
jgi:hypothetical protein